MKTTGFLALTSLFLAGCSVFGAAAAEEPAYRVIAEDGTIEVRQYGELLVASTEVQGAYRETSDAAFRRLAGFIFGKNRSRAKIAMTAPVVQEKTSEKIAMTAPVLQERAGDTWRMSFIMPAGYTLETLPEPLDPSIEISTIPARRVATIRFSGFLDEQKIERYADELEAWLEGNGYTALSAPRSAGYNPPWTLPPLRRNEIHIDVE